MPPPRDWTRGPAKWAAVAVLGSASLAGMTWSIFWRERLPSPHAAFAAVAPASPAPDEPVAPEAAATPPAAPPAARAVTRTINVNTASRAELELLPGIGPALAGRIIDHRERNGPFRTVDQLDDVKGIGPRTLERLRPLVRVE